MTEDLSAFMTDLALDLEEEEINVEDLNDIETNIEYPHLLLRTDDVLKVIKVIGPIINLKSTRNIPKSLTLYWDDEVLKYLITDDLSYFTQKVHLLNEDNILKETLCIPLNIIQAASKSFGKSILIYKKEDNYFLRLATGDLILDLVKPEEQLLKKPGVIGNEILFTSSSSLGDALKATLPILSCENIPEKRKLTFVNNNIEFTTGKFLILYEIEVPDMKISYKAAEFLKSLCNLYSGALYFYEDQKNANRIHIKCQDIEYTTFVGKDNITNDVGNFITEKNKSNGVWVSMRDFNSIVTLASSLNYAIGSINFNINKEGNLVVEIPNTRGTSSFVINRQQGILNLGENNNSVSVLSKSLKKLLGSFYGDSIYINVQSDCVVLKVGPITGVLLK